jgi:hypothetical protein
MRGLPPPVATLVLALALAVAPTAAAARPAQPAQMRAVVHAWSDRLNAGDNAGVARLFALPSVIVQGSLAYRFRTRHQLALWHSGLPCSGRIVSIAIKGRYATVVFRLGDRRTSKCDAPGSLAAARFQFADGKIALWVQIPVPEQHTETVPIA